MIEVELPDGTIAEFPDGTPQETIKGALQKRLAQPAPEEDQPWYVDAAQAADDMARLAASGMTFGFADKIAGAMGGEGTLAEREKTQAARDRAGYAAPVAEFGGAIATPMGLASKGLTLAGRGGTAAMGGLKGLTARSALMGAEGAGYGALTAAGNDQDIGTGAALGAAGGALGNVAGEGLSALTSKAAGLLNKKPVVDTPEQLRQAAAAAYEQADSAGGVFPAQSVDDLISGVQGKMAEKGFLPENQPGVMAGINALNRYRGQNVTFKGMEQLRRAVSKGYRFDNKDNNKMLHSFVRELDKFVENNSPNNYARARQLYAKIAKIDAFDNAVNIAKGRAGRTGSGGNLDNAIRQEVAKTAKRQYGLTPDERAAAKTVEQGTFARNRLRGLGAMGPAGNGLGKMMWGLATGGSALTGNPVALLMTLAGAGATGGSKSLATSMTKGSVNELQKLIAGGGSRAAITPPPNAIQNLATSKREALARALMALGVHGAVAP